MYVTASGAVLFASGVLNSCPNPPCITAGLWLWENGNITPILVNHTDPLPEAPPGFVLSLFEAVSANDYEHVVIDVASDYFEGHALYGWTPQHGLFPLAVPGTQYQVAPLDYRTVAGADIHPLLGGYSSGGVVLSDGVNSQGVLVCNVKYTDGTAGVYSGNFLDFNADYFPPGLPFCSGDGTSATACPCGNAGATGHGCDNSIHSGGALLSSSGPASLGGDGVVLASSGELPSALTIFLQGNIHLGTGIVFGDGVRCIGGTLKRIAANHASGGVASYPAAGNPSISQRSAALGDLIHAGTTRYYQAYYRDPSLSFCPNPPGNSWNVSSGQTILWGP
jgi:hypothetical protein